MNPKYLSLFANSPRKIRMMISRYYATIFAKNYQLH